MAGVLLAAAWLAVALLAPSPSEAAQPRQSATLGPIRMVPGTTLVGGLNIGDEQVTLVVTYESLDSLVKEQRFTIRPAPPANSGKTGVRGFGGDSSGIIAPEGGWDVAVTITAVEGLLADIVATLQLVDDETGRPIVVLAKPCQRCD